MPFPVAAAALLGVGALQQLIGGIGANRTARRMEGYGNQFMGLANQGIPVDTREIESQLRSVDNFNYGAAAANEVRPFAQFDMGTFNQSNAIRGARRNTYGTLLRAGRDAGAMNFGSAVSGRLGQMQQGMRQERMGLLGMLADVRNAGANRQANMYGTAASLYGGAGQMRNDMWSSLSGQGGSMMGLGGYALLDPQAGGGGGRAYQGRPRLWG